MPIHQYVRRKKVSHTKARKKKKKRKEIRRERNTGTLSRVICFELRIRYLSISSLRLFPHFTDLCPFRMRVFFFFLSTDKYRAFLSRANSATNNSSFRRSSLHRDYSPRLFSLVWQMARYFTRRVYASSFMNNRRCIRGRWVIKTFYHRGRFLFRTSFFKFFAWWLTRWNIVEWEIKKNFNFEIWKEIFLIFSWHGWSAMHRVLSKMI